jgi:hypothetical protein
VSVEVWGALRAGDESQAAYFREALEGEYRMATADLACARESLREVTEGSHAVSFRAAARARALVRDRQYQVLELVRLLGGLDRRFGTRSAQHETR